MSDRLRQALSRFVSARSDAELDALMSGWRRRPLLWAIFRLAPRRLDLAAAAGEAALVEVRVRDGRGSADRRRLLIGRGRCTVSRHDLGRPDSVVSFDQVSFLRFVTGEAQGRNLFLQRRLNVDGSLLLAAELPHMFRLRDAG